MNLFQQAKIALSRSNTDKKHPFRYCHLSTLSEEYPETRMVVNRKVDQDLTVFVFTDSRTAKVQQLQQNNKASMVFYHPKKRMQIRMKGTVVLINETHPDYTSYLNQLKQSPSLRDYTTLQPPGSSLTTPNVLHGTTLYFMALLFKPLLLDILLLDREGHNRCTYTRRGTEWIEQRLVP